MRERDLFRRIAVAAKETSSGRSGKEFRQLYQLDISNIQQYRKLQISTMFVRLSKP